MVLDSFERLASTINGFLEDCCDVGLDYMVQCNELRGAWRRWCRQNGEKPGGDADFGENLRATGLGITRV